MGDLAGSQTEGTGIRRSTLRLGCDGAAVARGVDDGAGERASSIPRVMSAMSSLSGDTIVYAGVSNGGTTTTDLTDISSSEVGDLRRGEKKRGFCLGRVFYLSVVLLHGMFCMGYVVCLGVWKEKTFGQTTAMLVL